MNALDRKLIETESLRHKNWVKLVNVLKHQFNEWATDRLIKHGYEDFKMVYMPVLMNIRPEGTNNNELAAYARVTKQAMSKVLKDLHVKKYIRSQTDPNDKRSTVISLTERGKKLVLECRLNVGELTEEYKKVVKSADFDRATETMRRIIQYNDEVLLVKK